MCGPISFCFQSIKFPFLYLFQVSKDVCVNTCNDTNTKIRILRQLARLYNLAEDVLVFSLVPQKDKGEALDL